jgi:hypothetical protein
MTDERRSVPRQRTLKGARIVINDGFSTFQCTVRNLSPAGAKLTLTSVVGIPDSFALAFDDGRRFACKVIWRTGTEIGVAFNPD